MNMKITELLDRRSILLNGAPASKKDALDQMIALMVKSGKIRDEEAYRQEVYRREEEGTTGPWSFQMEWTLTRWTDSRSI